jgi:hypothetical protein
MSLKFFSPAELEKQRHDTFKRDLTAAGFSVIDYSSKSRSYQGPAILLDNLDTYDAIRRAARDIHLYQEQDRELNKIVIHP